MHTTLLATLMLLLSTGTLCRNTVPEPRESQTSSPAPAPDRKVDPVRVSYDKFEDRTSVQVEIRPAKVALPDGSSELARVPLSARFECAGQNTKCSPSEVLLSHYGGAGLAWCDSMSVTFVADGERVRAGECHRLRGTLVVFQMSAAAFVTVSKASRVEAKIGAYVWSFDQESLDAVRALAAHIDAGPASQPEAH